MSLRPWLIWLVFALCLAVTLTALGWVSMTLLRLDRAEAEARREANLEEAVRLALWRMDSTVAPLIAQENARPYFDYSAFHPLERAYPRMFQEMKVGEFMMPSPLLRQAVPNVLIHFQIDPNGELASPQIPVGKMQALAVACSYNSVAGVEETAQRLEDLSSIVDRDRILAAIPLSTGEGAWNAATPVALVAPTSKQGAILSKAKSTQEWNARKGNFEIQTRLQRLQRPKQESQQSVAVMNVTEGLIQPLWTGDAMLLARRVDVNGEVYIQGCRLDWESMQQSLLADIADLLPDARLVPTADPSQSPQMLASLPVRLEPGSVPGADAQSPAPVRSVLILAWVCVLVAAAAVGLLLGGAVSLSERRGAFVSAVTHELRTPLTTFRMYTDMLEGQMVTDPQKRRQYLATMRTEADRLSVLVENVLSYSRLERGRPNHRNGPTTMAQLLDRIASRLDQRAAAAQMNLVVEADGVPKNLSIRADLGPVEQILFNLVDNAAKYAADATDRRIHLQAARHGDHLDLRVRDHGPGIGQSEIRSLFQPFTKSAREAAHTAPGVGLGLALSRRLARAMGGDLRLEDTEDGASFVLSLTLERTDGAVTAQT